jgi:dihydropteroate synthase
MLALDELAALAGAHAASLAQPISPIRIAGRDHDLDAQTLIMGVVNLSRDSTYRDSVAVGTGSAVRRGRIMAAQGAGLVDVGAESTTARAARVTDADQVRALVPVIEGLTAQGIATSVEAYSPEVVGQCLAAGAAVVNLTGRERVEQVYERAAEHGAAVVLCALPGATARDIGEAVVGPDPLPRLVDDLGARIEAARRHGVSQVMVDPGLGFYYANLTDPRVRVRHQAQLLLQSFRLRVLGVPICQALPHAYDLFEEEYRTAEGFFAVLALMGRTNVLRTHEVAHVAATLRAWEGLNGGAARTSAR